MLTKAGVRLRECLSALLGNIISVPQLRKSVWVTCWIMLFGSSIWAQNQKEYIYLDGRVIAIESSNTCSISPESQSIDVGGGSGSVSVTCGTGCNWTASSNNASWITITGGSSGTGNGTVTYSVTANTGSARNGTITIASQTFTINQASGCTYSISPESQSIDVGGGSGSVSVTCGTG
jgi:hypothetical protein